MTLQVYALTSSRHVPDVAGVRLSMIRGRSVNAIVAEARRTVRPTAHNLRRHHQVIATIADQLPSVLPVRFGTVMDDAELGLVLRARGPMMAARLRHVRGRVQMTIRISDASVRGTAVDAESTSRRTAATLRRPDVKKRPGTSYLERRAADVSAASQIPGFAPVRRGVARWIRDERIEHTAGVWSVYHLVPRRSSQIYARTMTAAAAAAGLRIVLSGPFPPYAFGAW